MSPQPPSEEAERLRLVAYFDVARTKMAALLIKAGGDPAEVELASTLEAFNTIETFTREHPEDGAKYLCVLFEALAEGGLPFVAIDINQPPPAGFDA